MGASNLGSNLGTEIAGFYVEKSKKSTDGASQKGSDVGSSDQGPDVSSQEISTQKTEETAEESCESVVTVETEKTSAEVSASDSQTNAEEELVEKVSEIDIKSDKSRYVSRTGEMMTPKLMRFHLATEQYMRLNTSLDCQ